MVFEYKLVCFCLHSQEIENVIILDVSVCIQWVFPIRIRILANFVHFFCILGKNKKLAQWMNRYTTGSHANNKQNEFLFTFDM